VSGMLEPKTVVPEIKSVLIITMFQ
jgi:hypothetical protein